MTTKICAGCGAEFVPNHRNTLNCKDLECIRARASAGVTKSTLRTKRANEKARRARRMSAGQTELLEAIKETPGRRVLAGELPLARSLERRGLVKISEDAGRMTATFQGVRHG